MIALFCGSRDWTEEGPIRSIMERLVRDRGLYLVVHGGQRGADAASGKVARSIGIQVLEEEADWNRLGQSAGPIRNEAMLRILLGGARAFGQIVHCYAFHEDPRLGKGTRDMVRRCTVSRIRSHVFLASTPKDIHRVSGECLCSECGLPYRKHPPILSELDSNGEPFLELACDGRALKL